MSKSSLSPLTDDRPRLEFRATRHLYDKFYPHMERFISANVLYRHVRELTQRTNSYGRALKLIEAYSLVPGSGRIDRLQLLLEAQAHEKQYAKAAKNLDERRRYGPLGAYELNNCIEIYRETKRFAEARECKRLLTRLLAR